MLLTILRCLFKIYVRSSGISRMTDTAAISQTFNSTAVEETILGTIETHQRPRGSNRTEKIEQIIQSNDLARKRPSSAITQDG